MVFSLNFKVLVLLFFVYLLNSCDSSEVVDTRSRPTSSKNNIADSDDQSFGNFDKTQVNSDGALLYEKNCLSCHPEGSKSNKNLEAILTALEQIPTMKASQKLQSLTEEDLELISDYLKLASSHSSSSESVQQPDPSSNAKAVLDGADLYKNNCLSCHPEGSRYNKSVQAIQNAIEQIPNMISSSFLQDLNLEDLEKISEYLKHNSLSSSSADQTRVGTALDGAGLYEENCLSCHPTGSKSNKSVEEIQSALEQIPNMNASSKLQDLSLEDLEKISVHLSTSSGSLETSSGSLETSSGADTTLDGETLYENNCLSCHPVGSKSGKSLQAIQNALNQIPTMNASSKLQNLSVEELEKISEYTNSL